MKKGFTLIELTISLAIAALMALVIYGSIRGYLAYKINTTNKICVQGMEMFISKSKTYCYSNNIEGLILIDMDKNQLTLSSKNKEIDSYSLINKALYMTNLPNNRITIKSSGKIANSGSIYFRDEKRDIHKITIHVGTGYVNGEE